MLLFSLFNYAILFLLSSYTGCDKNENIMQDEMNTVLYRNNLNSPVTLNITPVEIKPSTEKFSVNRYSPDENSKWITSRFINTARNSRLNSSLPVNKLWEVSWKTPLNDPAIPWSLMIKDERIIIQNESGWQLFDTSGKIVFNGIKGEGDLSIDPALSLFYFNDPSGFISATDLLTGKERFLFYPYLGNAYDRTILYSSGNKIISVGKEIPVMTHNSPIKTPELTLFELVDLGNTNETDEEGILNSAVQIENLICKSSRASYANVDSTIILAVPDHIYFIDGNLQIVKELVSKFIPLEISVDENMRIYLIAEVQQEDKSIQTEIWIIESDGKLISKTRIESITNNYLTPPVVDFDHNVYVRYENRITALNETGTVLWEQYVQKPFAGICASSAMLLCAEGNLLTAFDKQGERKFIFNFEGETLSTTPVLIDTKIYAATTSHLYCLTPKK